MLTVAPRGATKLVTRFEVPARFSRQSIVSGSVADEEEVEKAVIRAGDMAWACRCGCTRPMT
jgi:hypothetical protein